MFDSIPTPVKIALGVLAIVVVLAVLAPIVKAIIDALFVLVGLALLLGGGYLILTKTGILK